MRGLRWKDVDGFLSTPPSRVATRRRIKRKQPTLQFLSTPPSRVATPCRPAGWSPLSCFYPRHPRGWRQPFLPAPRPTMMFLSTPPSRVATHGCARCRPCRCCFYPRHPRGWRLRLYRNGQNFICVSIHATLAGGDSVPFPAWLAPLSCFYPRHPRGWRRQKCTKMYSVFCTKGKNYL